MKFSKLIQIAKLYEQYKETEDYIDSKMGMSVIIGCDCGCGGDYLSDAMDDPIYQVAPSAIRSFCLKHGVDLDVELYNEY